MDFWASLEHQLGYKANPIAYMDRDADLRAELKNCAEEIASVDVKMRDIYHRIYADAPVKAAPDAASQAAQMISR